ncbi:MAG: thioredoxin domain-containing protein [Myxococcales bacterium]|nr:thioredoxin domain-containing protein [Myxococcales bacterium]
MIRLLPLLVLTLAPAVVAAADGCPVPTSTLKPTQAVAKIDGKTVTLADLDARIADELCKVRMTFEMRQAELRGQALDGLVAERLLAAETKKRGLAGPDALIEAEVIKPVPPPDDAAVKAFYDQHQDRVGGADLASIGPQIRDHLWQEAHKARFDVFIRQLEKDWKVARTLPVFRLPVEATGPSRGPANAPVTIVAFADFECPYCARAAGVVESVRQRYGDKVRLVFRDFPLEFHQNAVPAAIAARCADAQGKFWPMHDALFSEHRNLTPPALRGLAEQLKLDLARYDACLADPRNSAGIEADRDAGMKVGVEGTPAFFINGVPLHGALPEEAFVAAIDAELARQAAGAGGKAR